jgi:molybdopterin-containing oxidoreductase family membrane subunit
MNREIEDRLVAPILHPPRWMMPALAVTFTITLMLGGVVAYAVFTGVGVWGNNIPVAWAFPITNFVWWIGIGHAGTFISAFLLLLEQKWRSSINRFAEAMTIFALVQAGLFPIIHLGRPWFAYWLIPYPSTMRVWPQFRSSLTWDVVAVTTYLTISVLFFYMGLVPDLAIMRDRSTTRARRIVYGIFALGWRGSVRTWSRYRAVYGMMAGIATPLVVSVHSIVSMDFAISILPGWHSHIFPPYFVAGAILSGFAMVFTLLLPARRLYRLESVITTHHLDMMARMLLLTSVIVGYSYAAECWSVAHSGDPFEMHQFFSTRARGAYAWAFWSTIACNVLLPQILWWSRARKSAVFLFVLSLFVQFGMWVERFMIITGSESQDFLPSSWGRYKPSFIDGLTLFGTLGFFLFLFLLFLRFVPFIPIRELQSEAAA